MRKYIFKTSVAILLALLVTGIAAQTSGTWTFTGNLNQARFNARSTLLGNGNVLLFGGQYQLRHATIRFLSELYDPATGVWTGSGNTNGVRLNSTATLLSNGKALAAAGCADTSCNTALATSELYDPNTGVWTSTGNLVTGRSYHTATLLPGGKVLAAGGCYSVCGIYTLSSAEIYDPGTGRWSATGNMVHSRAEHTATLLPSGKVLVAGGISGADIVASAEIYDPATGKWSAAGNMINARRFAQAARLSTGKVLVMGGQNYSVTLAAAEIYDPASNKWSAAGSMSTPRLYFAAVPLLNGKIMAAGGANPSVIQPGADLYDPKTGRWSVTGNMNLGRMYFTANVLATGQVLAAGGNVGDNTAELYQP